MRDAAESIFAVILLALLLVLPSAVAGKAGATCQVTRSNVGRETQRCEVAGVEHGCLAHSARSTPVDGECRCALRGGAVATYQRTP